LYRCVITDLERPGSFYTSYIGAPFCAATDAKMWRRI